MTIQQLEEKGYVILAYHIDIVKSQYKVNDTFAFQVLEDAVKRPYEDVLLSIETRLT